LHACAVAQSARRPLSNKPTGPIRANASLITWLNKALAAATDTRLRDISPYIRSLCAVSFLAIIVASRRIQVRKKSCTILFFCGKPKDPPSPKDDITASKKMKICAHDGVFLRQMAVLIRPDV
jgi:hypothetical protein